MFGIKSIIYKNHNNQFIINIGSINIISYNEILKPVDDKIIFKYLENLFDIINSWDKNYIDIGILDGNSWSLSINYQNGTKKEFGGHSKFPLNFEAFERLNRNLIDEVI